jgi:colanic acid/amylovoran biosynthesis glycosyltransferase
LNGSDPRNKGRCSTLPRRVVLVVQEFPQASETFIAAKFRELLRRGWDVHVACLVSRKANWNLFRDIRDDPALRARVHVAWPLRPRWVAALLTPLAALRCLVRNPEAFCRWARGGIGRGRLNRLYVEAATICAKPDLVHFEFGSLAASRVALADVLGVPVIVSFRGYDLNVVALDDSEYYDDVWRRAAAIHVLGADLRDKARARGCPPRMPCATIPPAVDAERFSPGEPKPTGPVATEDRPFRVLSVGRLDWRKGYEYAAQAIGSIASRGLAVEWEVVGRGEHLEAIAFAAHQAGIRRATRFLGHLPTGDVRDHMRRADVFLHPAVSEGFCNAVLEAQAVGLPVVCSDAGGLPENVEDGVTGYVVPRRDAAALADRLAVLAADPDLRSRFGAAGVDRVRRHFRFADQVSRFEEFYLSVVRVPGTSPPGPGNTG